MNRKKRVELDREEFCENLLIRKKRVELDCEEFCENLLIRKKRVETKMNCEKSTCLQQRFAKMATFSLKSRLLFARNIIFERKFAVTKSPLQQAAERCMKPLSYTKRK